MNIVNIFSQKIVHSAYLTRLSNMDYNAELDSQSWQTVQLASTLESLISEIRSHDVSDIPYEDSQAFLVEMKCKFALHWAMAQLCDQLPFDQLGKLQSEFAAATIDCALKVAWYSPDLKSIHKHLPPAKTEVPGLFVLGLGKLGGLDLNFSSDVDLVAFYDEQALPIPEAIGKGYIANKVLQKMTQILTNDHNIDFVWRVDWRLRPESSSSLLCMNTDSAKEFYYFRALPWHRLAMMKAKPVAGDKAIANQFLEDLQSFIWRQNLDLNAIDDIAHIKKRINQEHPSLKHQRKQKDTITDDCENFNLKLGNGGIREIEFIINALQLLWGGKKPELRVNNTLSALEQLNRLEFINIEDLKLLKKAYQFFRKAENAVQMLDNAQTHLIPNKETGKKNFLALLQNPTDIEFSTQWNDFATTIQKFRVEVHRLFEELFQKESDAQLGPYELPEGWENHLNERSIAIIENWSTGFTGYDIPSTMAVSLEPLMHQLFSKVFEQGLHDDIDKWMENIDNFFASQNRSHQYFRLLASYPQLVENIVPPLQYSPHMCELLKQSPHIVDHLILPKTEDDSMFRLDSYQDKLETIFIDKDYGNRLSSLRRYVNENLYAAYLDFMQGEINVKIFQLCLTRLAECTIQASLEIAKQELKLNSLPMAVLGMGKLAMSRMSPLSDLDLIFIFADDFEIDIAQKVVSRLQTILGMKLQEGIAYEIDTRLRPSGRSGPTTVFISGFRAHQLQRAKTWEHIALLPSRIVAGDQDLGKEVIKIKHEVFARKINRDEWFSDIKDMWSMIADQRIQNVNEKIVSSKLRSGGLMQAEYLGVCICIEQLTKPDFFEKHAHNIDRFSELLKSAQQLFDLNLDIHNAIEFWSTVQIWERLLGLTNQRYEEIPEHLQILMCEQLHCDSLEHFYKKSEHLSWLIEHAMEKYFSESSTINTANSSRN